MKVIDNVEIILSTAILSKKSFSPKRCKYYKEMQSLHLLSTVKPPEVVGQEQNYGLRDAGNVLNVQKT